MEKEQAELVERLEKVAGIGGLVAKIPGYLKNVTGMNVRKAEKNLANATSRTEKATLQKDLHNTKVDRNIARAGTAGAATIGGAGLGGYSAYQKSKEPMSTDIQQQNQQSNQVQQPQFQQTANEDLLDRLEKVAEGYEDKPLTGHVTGSAIGAGATGSIGAILGGVGGLGAASEALAAPGVGNKLKGLATAGLGAAGGAVVGAIPGSVVGGAIGSLKDYGTMLQNDKGQSREAVKEAIKEELREEMANKEASELVERLEKAAGFFGNVVDATGIAAKKARRAYDEVASPQGFLQHEPQGGVQQWQDNVQDAQLNMKMREFERDAARQELQPVAQNAMIGAGAVGIAGAGIAGAQHQYNQLKAEALAELEAEQQAGQGLGASVNAAPTSQEAPAPTPVSEGEEVEEEVEEPKRQGAGSVSNNPAGVDKSASELMERLEKAAGIKDELKGYVKTITGSNHRKAKKALAETEKNKPMLRFSPELHAGDMKVKKMVADYTKRERDTTRARAAVSAGTGAAAGGAIGQVIKENKKNKEKKTEKTASELMEHLEKAAGLPGISAIKEKAVEFGKNVSGHNYNQASKKLQEGKNSVVGWDLKPSEYGDELDKLQGNVDFAKKQRNNARLQAGGAAATVGAFPIGVGVAKHQVDKATGAEQDKEASELIGRLEKAAADKEEASKEESDVKQKTPPFALTGAKLKKSDDDKEKEEDKKEENPSDDSQSKEAAEVEDLDDALFKEASAIIAEFAIPEVKTYVDPIHNIHF